MGHRTLALGVQGDRQRTSPLCLECFADPTPTPPLFTRLAPSGPPGFSFYITSSEKPSLTTSTIPHLYPVGFLPVPNISELVMMNILFFLDDKLWAGAGDLTCPVCQC